MVLNISKFSSVFFLIYIYSTLYKNRSFPGGSNGKESACNAGDMSLIPWSKIFPGEGNGNPLQYSCIENPMDGGAWQALVHGVAQSWKRWSD